MFVYFNQGGDKGGSNPAITGKQGIKGNEESMDAQNKQGTPGSPPAEWNKADYQGIKQPGKQDDNSSNTPK